MSTKFILLLISLLGIFALSMSKSYHSKISAIVDNEDLRLKKEIETNAIWESSEEFAPTSKSLELSNQIQKTLLRQSNKQHIPIVYWHGMGDSGDHVKRALQFIEQELPGVYVKSLQIGSTIPEDVENGYFMNVNDQIAMVCEMLKNDSKLQEGYNAIGLSQGGQFLRAVAQRCPEPRMFNLISLGGQHQGIFGIPKCQAPKQEWCEIIDKLLTHVAYSTWVQKFLVQSEYWHDPFKNEDYINKSIFLADINNERTINETYKNNLQLLDNFVLVLFEDETVVQPKQTEWFGFFQVGSDSKMLPLEDSSLYTEDRLGLKAMNEQGKLHFLSSPGDHLRFTNEWFIKNIVKPFLA